MLENESFIAQDISKRAERWLHREDTWLAQGLKRISPLEGCEYRQSEIKRNVELVVTIPVAIATVVPTGMFFIASSLQEPVGHPFYKQERQKTRDEVIKITKFRTMKPNSDGDPNFLLSHTANYSPESDPRNTQLGKILRAYEFDELPQLFEVLQGKLSLIDIRSMATRDFDVVKACLPDVYNEWETAYFEGKPGLFSLNSAVNSDRKHVLKRQRFDIFHARHASLGLDFLILYRTGLRMMRKAEQKIRKLGGKELI